jgi:putative nucleotidyltransferase with HDIG domain
MWTHSLATAYAAKLIAQRLGRGDADELFLMGLTHDIGKVFLLRAFADESAIKGTDMKLLLANIQEAHIGIGSLMLKRWGYQEAFVRAVSLHDKTDPGPESLAEGLIVNLANMISHSLGFRVSERAKSEPAEFRSAELLNLTPEAVREIGDATRGLIKDLASHY